MCAIHNSRITFWIWLKRLIHLGAVFCLGVYYVLYSSLEIMLYFHSERAQLRSHVIFNALLFLATSALFFSSNWLMVKKEKHFHVVFASALISASVSVFNAFGNWVDHAYSLMYSEWMVIGAIVAMIFTWWVRRIFLSEEMNKQINGENTPLDDRIHWRADDACACLVSLVYSSILISSVYILLNCSWLHSPFGLLVSSVCSYLVFLAVTLKFSKVKTAQSFRQCFGFVIPNLYTCMGALLSGGAIAALAVCLVNHRLLAPHSQLQESFRGAGVGYFDCLLLLAPFWEEVVIRGYLYKAFRQDYSMAASVYFMMAIASLSHFSAIFSASLAFVPLLGVNIILSLFREKTDSIWNCIACHFAYNAVCLYGDKLFS